MCGRCRSLQPGATLAGCRRHQPHEVLGPHPTHKPHLLLFPGDDAGCPPGARPPRRPWGSAPAGARRAPGRSTPGVSTAPPPTPTCSGAGGPVARTPGAMRGCCSATNQQRPRTGPGASLHTLLLKSHVAGVSHVGTHGMLLALEKLLANQTHPFLPLRTLLATKAVSAASPASAPGDLPLRSSGPGTGWGESHGGSSASGGVTGPDPGSGPFQCSGTIVLESLCPYRSRQWYLPSGAEWDAGLGGVRRPTDTVRLSHGSLG